MAPSREAEKALENLVRVGIVTDTKPDSGQVRVKFPKMNVSSGWLAVMQHPDTPVNVETSGTHSHEARLGRWMPQVNDTVLVL